MDDKATILLGSDHAGFALKSELLSAIQALGYEVIDRGPSAFDPEDDYPDYVLPMAQDIGKNPHTVGVFLSGSGQGEAMAANRVKGVRAAVFYGPKRVTGALELEGGSSEDGFDIVRLARRHNNANFLSIGGRFVGHDEAVEAIRIFLGTPFIGPDRHARRIAKF